MSPLHYFTSKPKSKQHMHVVCYNVHLAIAHIQISSFLGGEAGRGLKMEAKIQCLFNSHSVYKYTTFKFHLLI